MHIRQLKLDDFQERIALFEFAFQYKLPPERLQAVREQFRPEEDWGAFDDDGKLLSALSLLPFEIYVNGRVLKMGGLAGVASWPETRRGGNITKLLVRSLEVMREQGQTISMLHPFAFPFYRKFGWEFTIERKRYDIDMALLPKRKDTAGSIERVPKEAARFEAIYGAFASRFNGTLHRAEDYWKRKVLHRDGLAAIWRNDEGTPEGYIVYDVRDRKLTVQDWACTSEAGRIGLWSFIANHDSMAERVQLDAPSDDPLPFLLPDPRIKQELVAYFMSRIVDVAGLAAQYPFREAAAEERLTLEVRDEYAPWNNRRFRFTFGADGSCRAEAAEASPATEPAAVCDIRALTAMLLGNRRPLWLHDAGLLQGDRHAAELLERRVPARTAYLADFF